MEKSNPVVFEVRGKVAIITFGRPEIRNPLSLIVLTELERLLDEVKESASLEKLVFTGTGGVFASGADLREINLLSAETAPAFARRGQAVMDKIERIKIETIAAIDGFCFGGALDLTLACDRRFASAASRFCHPGAGLGIITGWGGTQRLPRLIGTANAMEMLLTASPISAEEALRVGLIDLIAENPLEFASS